jgi:hypothetical protein
MRNTAGQTRENRTITVTQSYGEFQRAASRHEPS